MQEEIFYRPARAFPPKLPQDHVVVSAPPISQTPQSGATRWARYLLPAIGGMGSLIFVFAYHSSLLLVIAGLVMAFGMAGSGVIIGVMQDGNAKKQRLRQNASYVEYLANLRKRLVMVANEQHLVDRRLYPSSAQMIRQVEQREHLWERRPTDHDFLHARIGSGPRPLAIPLSLDLRDDDFQTQFVPELRTAAEALIDQFSHLADLSATLSLRDFGVLTISGEMAHTRALARALLCQLAVFQAPEDMHCLLYCPIDAIPDWEWFKLLPHARSLRPIKVEKQSSVSSLSLFAFTADDLQTQLQQQFEPELERRQRMREEDAANRQNPQQALNATLPHLVVVLDSFVAQSDVGRIPELDRLFKENVALGVTVICLVHERSEEPQHVQARITLAASGRLSFEELSYGGQRMAGLMPDAITPQHAKRIARSMASLSLAKVGNAMDLSEDVRLLDLLGIVSSQTFDTAQSWRPRLRGDFLRVPIGQRADGRIVTLDLKEAADKGMGPHGLIVGATGSGKSELMRTLVAALAITHNPETLNFVLVDFKGGASFADFASLPHVAGVVTNLQSDLSLVDRVYFSLLGEQQRRQNLLHDAGNLDNIKQYQALKIQQPGLEPLPSLLIIVDEFAELIALRPDFLDLFVTIGRVGRSLGLHLLFATQRLEEGRIKGLESHLRYRICLRTFSAAESKVVLGQSDAYYLPSVPGVGYFKVDTDTYDLFKSALISVPVAASPQHDLSLSLVHTTIGSGSGTRQSSPAGAAMAAQEPNELHTEMDVVIQRLASATSQSAHQVWLPPLPRELALGSVLQQCERPDLDGSTWETLPPFGELRVPVGLVDMPLQQAQEPLWLDFAGIGGHLALVGAPQSGKSTFLRTLLTAFLLTHSPQAVQFYCIDMGGGQLRIFEPSPHVGAVCGKSERDKVRRLIRQMQKIIEEREVLFREQGIDSIATFRAQRQKGALADIPFGDVFLVIDNAAQFFQEFEQLEADVMQIAANGLTYGVHLIIAANRWAEVRAKLRDNIGTRLELRLNDPLESELGKATATAIPLGVPGRGATRDKLQFHIALPVLAYAKAAQQERNQVIQEALAALIQQSITSWTDAPAPRILMLPAHVHYEDLPPPEKQSGIPIGLEEFRLSTFTLDLLGKGPHLMIVGDSECGKTTLLRTLLRGIERGYPSQEVAFAIVDYRKDLLDFAESKHLLTYAYNATQLTSCVGNLKADLERRAEKNAQLPLSEQRKTHHWGGRHYFVFVDNYESLTTSGDNQLTNIADYLLDGSAIGFHLIVTHHVNGFGRTSYEPIFQRLREAGTATLVMSGDTSEGRIFSGHAAMTLPAGRGQYIEPRRPPLLIQTAFTPTTESGE